MNSTLVSTFVYNDVHSHYHQTSQISGLKQLFPFHNGRNIEINESHVTHLTCLFYYKFIIGLI